MPAQYVIFIDDSEWSLGIAGTPVPSLTIIDAPKDAAVTQRAEALSHTLQAQGYIGQSVVLAIPSAWCLSAMITTDNLPRRDRGAAMTYRLEEKLPIAAEQFVADFILTEGGHGGRHGGSAGGRGGEALGVCAMLGKVGPVVEALESHGLLIHSIVPTAMLAAQHHRESEQITDNPHADMLLWLNDDGWCDVFIFDAEHPRPHPHPRSWLRLPNDRDTLTLHLNMMSIHSQERMTFTALGDDTVLIERNLAELSSAQAVNAVPLNLLFEATQGAASVLSDRSRPWINLRRGELSTFGSLRLIKKPMMAALCAAVLFLICLNAVMLWRAHEYQQMADDYATRQRQVFVKVFLGQNPPLAIRSRLASEKQKLSGLRGQSTNLPPRPKTMALLHDILTRLPKDTRFRIVEISVRNDTVTLDGEARSHRDIGDFAKSLRSGDALEVDTRHTEQLSGKEGVGFMIVVSPKPTK